MAGLHGWFGFELGGISYGIQLEHVVSYRYLTQRDAQVTQRITMRMVDGTEYAITEDEDIHAFLVREDAEYVDRPPLVRKEEQHP